METFQISFSLSVCLDLSASVSPALLLISPHCHLFTLFRPPTPLRFLAFLAAATSRPGNLCSRLAASRHFKMAYILLPSPVCFNIQQPGGIKEVMT